MQSFMGAATLLDYRRQYDYDHAKNVDAFLNRADVKALLLCYALTDLPARPAWPEQADRSSWQLQAETTPAVLCLYQGRIQDRLS